MVSCLVSPSAAGAFPQQQSLPGWHFNARLAARKGARRCSYGSVGCHPAYSAGTGTSECGFVTPLRLCRSAGGESHCGTVVSCAEGSYGVHTLDRAAAASELQMKTMVARAGGKGGRGGVYCGVYCCGCKDERKLCQRAWLGATAWQHDCCPAELSCTLCRLRLPWRLRHGRLHCA